MSASDPRKLSQRMREKGISLAATVIDVSSASSLRRRLLSGGTWSFVGKVGGSIIGVVTNGLLARLLTPQEFGAYFLALSIIMFGAVVGSLGLPKTGVRFVAESMAFNQLGRTRRVIYTTLGLSVLGALGVSLA